MTEWTPFRKVSDRPSAEALAELLLTRGVPARIEERCLLPGVNGYFAGWLTSSGATALVATPPLSTLPSASRGNFLCHASSTVNLLSLLGQSLCRFSDLCTEDKRRKLN
jgi:hypothetical protein